MRIIIIIFVARYETNITAIFLVVLLSRGFFSAKVGSPILTPACRPLLPSVDGIL
jgi:hypothetical protein